MELSNGVTVDHNNPPIREYTPLQVKSDFAFQTKCIQSEPFQKVVSGIEKALHSRTVGLTCPFFTWIFLYHLFYLCIIDIYI